MQTKKAFTIVELLVVMAVIGVLLSLAVFGIQALQKSQRETQRMNDLRNVQGALESFYSKYKRYPINGIVTTTEIKVVGTDFEIFNGATSYTKVPIASLGAVVPLLASTTTYVAGCAAGTSTSDMWTVMYRTLTATPQQYALYGCTENGKTTNLGAKND